MLIEAGKNAQNAVVSCCEIEKLGGLALAISSVAGN